MNTKKFIRTKFIIIIGIVLAHVPVIQDYEDDLADKKLKVTDKLEEVMIEENVEKKEIDNSEVIYAVGQLEDNPSILTTEESLSYLALVNQYYRLADDFEPRDLSIVNVESLNGEHLLRTAVARAAEELFTEANKAGHILLATSGYRSFTTQESTHNYWIDVLGLEEAKRVSAKPGHSEHQLGLALDLSTHSLGGYLTEEFSLTPEGIWVKNNAHRFGFIIRYPENRETDTGFSYEPWHIRYVGVEAATEIFNNGQILEAFLKDEL